MKKDHHVDLINPLARRTVTVATMAAFILTLGSPLSLYISIIKGGKMVAASYAHRMADLVSEVVITQPDLWYYDAPKLASHLALLVEGPDVERVVIIDASGRRIDVPSQRSEATTKPSPFLWWAEAPVFRGHQEIARVWVAIDMTPGMTRVILSLLLSFLLGATLSTLLYIVPVQVVSKAEGRIRDLLMKLDSAHRELSALNADLEQRVEKRSHQLAKTAEALQHSKARLRDVAGRAVEATEQERQRVARELHDGAGQQLTAIHLSLQVLKTSLTPNQQSDARLAEAEHLVDETIDELRRIAMNLHPAALDRLGLIPGLSELCSGVASRSGLAIEFDADENVPDLLPAAVESSAYRFVQECLTNTLRYAKARELQVSLKIREEALVLRASDDGQGFEPAKIRGGLGLRGMRDRTDLLGGTLAIESSPGMGTHIEATFPIIRSEDADGMRISESKPHRNEG